MKTTDYYWNCLLVEREREIFIRDASRTYSAPEEHIFFWKVDPRCLCRADRAELPLPAHRNGDGTYTVRTVADLDRECSGYNAHFTVALINGGRTAATWIDIEPIPCPKVRKGIETRWSSRGYWEKYTKRDGWIVA